MLDRFHCAHSIYKYTLVHVRSGRYDHPRSAALVETAQILAAHSYSLQLLSMQWPICMRFLNCNGGSKIPDTAFEIWKRAAEDNSAPRHRSRRAKSQKLMHEELNNREMELHRGNSDGFSLHESLPDSDTENNISKTFLPKRSDVFQSILHS